MSRLDPGDSDLHYPGGRHRTEQGGASTARSARFARRLDEHLRQHEYIDALVGATVPDEENE